MSERNMYGCTPCPKCTSRYRYPTQDCVIHCDDCGYRVQASPRWDAKLRTEVYDELGRTPTSDSPENT